MTFKAVPWLLFLVLTSASLFAAAQDAQPSNSRVVLGPNAQVILGPNAQVVPEGGAGRQRTGGAGATLTPIQLQILEATRKTHEATVEQARAIAQANAEANKQAMEAVKGLALASIEQNKRALDASEAVSAKAIVASTSAVDQIKNLITLAAGMVAVLVAVAGFMGWKKMSSFQDNLDAVLEKVALEADKAVLELQQKADTLYTTLAARLEQAGERAESAVAAIEAALASVEERVKTIEGDSFPRAASIAIDIAMFLNVFERFIDGKRDATTVKDLFHRLNVIEESAKHLNDRRTVSWVEGNRALVYYYVGDFASALTHQLRACEFWNEQTRFDRQRNLACIAGKLYATTAEPNALALAVRTLEEMETYINQEQAADMLNDTDLTAVFETHPERKSALVAIRSRQ